MATETTNLGLTKDAPNEFYDIAKINANLDKVDEAIGNNSIDDTLVPTTDTGLSVKILLSWLAHMIKSITGKSSWRIKPTKNLEELNTAINDVNATVGNKVDKVAGKQLSDTNYTIGEKMKLEGVEAGAQKNTISSVNNKTGAVTLNANDVNAMPLAGGTFTGKVIHHANTEYAVAQGRNAIISTADASGVAPNGGMWLKYKP